MQCCHINRGTNLIRTQGIRCRYLLENIEIFYVPVRSMGAIMYSFA